MNPNKSIVVYDNGGQSADRYTVIIGGPVYGNAYGMSTNADMPNGFNQYIGPARGLAIEKLGRLVPLIDLPDAVQRSIKERVKDDEEEETPPADNEPSDCTICGRTVPRDEMTEALTCGCDMTE